MDTFILNSELEFRNYIISFSNEIMKIIIFEDTLDNIIYFYCFTRKLILATKESNKPFVDYVSIYTQIKDKLNLKTCIEEQKKVLRLIR